MIAGWTDEDIAKFDETSLNRQVEAGEQSLTILRKQVEDETIRVLDLKRVLQRKQELNHGPDH